MAKGERSFWIIPAQKLTKHAHSALFKGGHQESTIFGQSEVWTSCCQQSHGISGNSAESLKSDDFGFSDCILQTAQIKEKKTSFRRCKCLCKLHDPQSLTPMSCWSPHFQILSSIRSLKTLEKYHHSLPGSVRKQKLLIADPAPKMFDYQDL